MIAPALTIAWMLWRRHRWGLSLVLAWLVGVCLLYQVVPSNMPLPPVSATASVPFAMAFFYALAVFTLGFEADVTAPRSGYPARMFTLPVPTAVLVGVPMLCGTAAVAFAWTALVVFVYGRDWADRPVWGLLLVYLTVLAWLQVVVWAPFRLPWVRAVLAAAVVCVPLPAVLICLDYQVPEVVIVTVLAALLPLAYAAAYLGVCRARRGDGAEVPGMFRLGWATPRGPWGFAPFASPGQAQRWWEQRRGGWAYLLVVGGAVLAVVLLLWLVEPFQQKLFEVGVQPTLPGLDAAGSSTVLALVSLLGVPLLFGLVGCPGATGVGGRNPLVMSPFLATRPMATTEFVAVKLRLAAGNALATWGLTLLGVAGWVVLGGKGAVFADVAGRWFPGWGVLPVAGLLGLGVVGLVGLTWICHISGLPLALTGRSWVVLAILILSAPAAVGLLVFGQWVYQHPQVQPQVWAVLTGLAAAAVVLKVVAAVWTLGALLRRGLASGRGVAVLVGAWGTAAAVVFGVLAWLVPGAWVPAYGLALGVVLMLPLTRIAAAPLALAWNRHR